MITKKVTIIGAGPAGIATAIQLRRWGVEPCLLEKDHIGGLLVNANLVENYPGFPHGISGPELVSLFESQLTATGEMVNFEEVLHLDYDKEFIIKTSKRIFNSQIVVVASGTRPKTVDEFEIPREIAERIFYEVYPLIDQTERKVAIIGSGDAAFDYALNLASRENKITILNRSRKIKCLPLLWERAQSSSRITYLANTLITGMQFSGEKLVLRCRGLQEVWELGVDYVVFAIGRRPELGFLSERLVNISAQLERKCLLYFVGDVKNNMYRQASIAIGEGVKAAMRICRMFEEAVGWK